MKITPLGAALGVPVAMKRAQPVGDRDQLAVADAPGVGPDRAGGDGAAHPHPHGCGLYVRNHYCALEQNLF